MLCWSCQKIKGKRACPAHGGELICPKCCGSKRRVEIRCTADCAFLRGEHDPRWQSTSRKTDDVRFIAHFSEMVREQLPFLIFLHQILLQARQRYVSDMSDQEALEVVTLLTRTYETLSKGVVYQHQSENPRLQTVINWVGRVLERRSEIPETPRASDSEVLTTLQHVAAAIQAHREQATGARNYLDTAERVFREALEGAPAVEVPDEKSGSGSGGLIVKP